VQIKNSWFGDGTLHGNAIGFKRLNCLLGLGQNIPANQGRISDEFFHSVCSNWRMKTKSKIPRMLKVELAGDFSCGSTFPKIRIQGNTTLRHKAAPTFAPVPKSKSLCP
jgi:hypothetical protein